MTVYFWFLGLSIYFNKKSSRLLRSNSSVWIKTKTIIYNFSFFYNISMSELSLNELKLVAKSRGIKGYKSMSKERLLSAFIKSESVESKNSFDDERLKKVRKDFNDKRLNTEIWETKEKKFI